MTATRFAASFISSLQVEVNIHPDLKALQRAYTAASGACDPTTVAFCNSSRPVENDIVAVLHFHQGDMDAGIIGHEALHAALTLARYLRLNLEDLRGEEVLADTVENIVRETLAFKKKSVGARQR